MRPIELIWTWIPMGAITLWPFIIYNSPYYRHKLRAHEMFHWDQAKRSGVVPWYVAYVVLLPMYLRDIKNHPLEREAYQQEVIGGG